MVAAEEVISSAIENLESWLLKDQDYGLDSFRNLRSWLYEKADLSSWHFRVADSGEDSEEKLYSMVVEMADYGLAVKDNLYSLLVSMADFWEHNSRQRIFCLLVRVANPWKDSNSEENLCSFLVEMTDLWEDTDGKLMNKQKLQSLVVELAGTWRHDKSKLYKKKVYGLLVEIAGLWKDSKGKLDMGKVYGWVAEKADLWEHKQLFSLVLRMALHEKFSYEYKLVREKVEEAKHDLRLILDFLTGKELEETDYLVSDVVEMAHDARVLIGVEDSVPLMLFLEIFNTDYGSIDRDTRGFLEKMTFIREGLQELKERMLQFGVEKAMRSQNVGELAPWGGGGDVVGLGEDIKLLLHNESRTTFIRGMTGIGKTTLARELYNHPTVVDRFQCRIWVCVSREYLSRKELLMKLIPQVVVGERDDASSSLEKMDNRSLQHMFHQHLQGMRYFLVLDDLDEHTYLNYVMDVLPQDEGEGKGSRWLFTTRSADRECISPNDFNHEMKFLNDDMSWKLLLKTVFFGNSGQKIPKELEKQGRQMLRKCNGLPLAIKEVGREWAKERLAGREWEEIVESINLRETLEALESTYHNLDPQVRSCFLHLSFFKEGTTIRANKLVRFWLIGGVFTQEDLLEQYCYFISQLSKESIIEVKEMGKTSHDIKSYRIHNVFHWLSIKKAEEEISLEILRNDGNNRLVHEPRHRVIYCSREKFNYSKNPDKYIVSIFLYGGGNFDASPSYWNNFERLEILEMEDFGLKILPDAIGRLIELRYLGLRNNYIQELPHSLSNLKNLEILDIALNFMVEVGDIIWEMESLHHLYMSDISCQKPFRIDGLKNLVTLTYISVNNWTYEVSGLKMMTSLTRLGIEEVDGNTEVSKLFASLAELENLKFIMLRGFRYRSMPCLDGLRILYRLTQLKLDGHLTRLPSANDFPPNIQYLTLVNSCLDEDPMPILEKLPHLYCLKLQNAYTGQQMAISLDGFGNLHFLVIGELWHLRNIQVQRSAMQNLERLEINHCPCLETLPKVILWKGREELKMVTTKHIATKIRKSGFISRVSKVDLQP